MDIVIPGFSPGASIQGAHIGLTKSYFWGIFAKEVLFFKGKKKKFQNWKCCFHLGVKLPKSNFQFPYLCLADI